jgi:hypothetical protein
MNTPLLIGALIVAIIVLWGMISIVKTTLKTALTVAIIVFALQVLTSVGPQQVFDQIMKWLGGIGNWLQRWGSTYKAPTDFPSPSPRSLRQLWFVSFFKPAISVLLGQYLQVGQW